MLQIPSKEGTIPSSKTGRGLLQESPGSTKGILDGCIEEAHCFLPLKTLVGLHETLSIKPAVSVGNQGLAL